MADEPNLSTPDAGDLNQAARDELAKSGEAMNDGSYPIRSLDNHGRADLEKAIRAVGRGGGSHDAIRRHVIKRAGALGLSDMIPDNWTSGGESRSAAVVSDEQATPPRAPVEHRESNITGVNFAQRIIEMVVVPYGESATVEFRGELWQEEFERGSFDGIEKRPNRVRANREHDKARTVGKAVKFWPSRDEGLVTEVRVAQTPLGDETLALADEEILGGSVGFAALGRHQELNRRDRVRRIKRAFLDHIAFTVDPSYAGARVLSVRDHPKPPPAPTSALVTPDLDQFTEDDVLRWASERFPKE